MFQLNDVNFFFCIIRNVYHVYGMVVSPHIHIYYTPIDTVPVDSISVGLAQARPNYDMNIVIMARSTEQESVYCWRIQSNVLLIDRHNAF